MSLFFEQCLFVLYLIRPKQSSFFVIMFILVGNYLSVIFTFQINDLKNTHFLKVFIFLCKSLAIDVNLVKVC